MKINLDVKSNRPTLIIVGVIVLSFLISLLCFGISYSGKKRTFIFSSVDEGQHIIETRYLRKSSIEDPINTYVKELLLGPESERTMSLFSKDTKLLSCFEKDGVLYVNLSEDMLDLGDNVLPFDEGIKLMIKNIKHNFNGIKTVEIYVDGKGLYDNY